MKSSAHTFCHGNNLTPCPQLVLELCIRLQMKSSAHNFFVMTTTLPHAPTLYWNYVLGYEIRHTDYFCCHDIEPPPTPHPPYHPNHFVLELCIRLQMKSFAHTIFVMTTTLPHAPTLYWNYVLAYESRPSYTAPLSTLPPTLYWNYVLCYK